MAEEQRAVQSLNPLMQGRIYKADDEFYHDVVAGSVDGTLPVPGPGGPRLVEDTGSRFSLTGGKASVTAGGAAGDPGLWLAAQANEPGLAMIVEVTFSNTTGIRDVGWDSNLESSLYHYIRFTATAASRPVAATVGNRPLVGVYSATVFLVVIALRGAGLGFYIIVKGGTYTEWELLWVDGSTAALVSPAPAVQAREITTFSFVRVLGSLWPVPQLAVDTFTRANSDSLGNTEVVGPEGQELVALAWVTIGGDFDILSNAVVGGDAQGNLLVDPGFETFTGTPDDGTTDDWGDWTELPNTGGIVEAVTTPVHGGSYAVKMTKGSVGSTFINQTLAVTAGRIYRQTGWVYGTPGAGSGRMRIYDETNAVFLFLTDGTSAAAWQFLTAVFAAPTGCENIRYYYYVVGSTADVAYADDALLVECHAEYVDLGEADVQLVYNITTPASGTDPFGIILRRNGATQWLVQITPGTAGTDLELIELNDGAPTVQASADVDWVAATDYEIQISCNGAVIDVFVDNVEEMTYASATVGQTNTQFGIWDSAEGNATFLDAQWMSKKGAAYSAFLDQWAGVHP
jgi:hypothetical protein